MDLNEFFKENNKVAIAFSGGVDSCYLLYAAKKAKAEVKAYFVKSEFQPEFEVRDAEEVAAYCHAELEILSCSILQHQDVVENPKNRCYYCKRHIFSQILEKAKADGFSTILDGTNASDDVSDRPGYKALQEMKVLSPLRLCGLTKKRIRELSKEAGLVTWNKPSYACLATRIPTGTTIEKEMLEKTEKAEDYLKSLGFEDFRVRYLSGYARVQLPSSQIPAFLEQQKTIAEELKKWYSGVLLDMETRG